MKKSMVKRIIAICLISIMTIGLFTACSNDSDGRLVVRVWSGEGATKEFMTKKVEEFNKSHNDIKIEYQVISSNLDDMTKNAFENGNGPEIFTASIQAAEMYQKLGFIVSINELDGGQEYLDNLRIEIPDYPNYIVDGKVYSYPISSLTGGLVYNKDLFKKANIVDENGEAKPPVTWDEMIDACKKISALGNDKYGTGIPMKDGIVWSYGFNWAASASQNGNVEYDYQNGTAKFNTAKMLEYILKLKKDKSIFPGSESLDNDTLRLQFAEGNIGMFFGVSWDVGVLVDQFPAKCDWAVAPYPTYNENGDYYQQTGQASGSMRIGNSALASPEMSKAVMEVYKWLYSDEITLEKFEEGLAIPYDTTISEKADKTKVPPQWMQFCDLMNITRAPSRSVSLKIEGDKSAAIYDKVYVGKMSVKEAIDDLNTRYSAALKKGIDAGDINPADYPQIDYKRED